MIYEDYKFSSEGLCYINSDDHIAISDSIRAFLKQEKQMSLEMNTRIFSIKKDEAGRRRITHWVKEGILNENREGKVGWRKFSFIEVLWLSVINILRDTGYSMDKIRSVKKSLSDIKGAGSSEYPVLEYGFYCAYHIGDPTFLVILPNGRAELVYGNDLSFDLHMPHLHFIRSFFTISLNGLVGNLFEEQTIYLKVPASISSDRQQLLRFMDNQDFQQVHFEMKDGRIRLIEGTFTKKGDAITAKEIQEQLRKYSHQRVEIKQYDHNIREINATIQYKVKD